MRLRHPKVWIFDLDDTLHRASVHIFPALNKAMTKFLMDELSLNEEAANQLRWDYWQKYGATLRGLIRHHDTDPHHFLRHTHDLPQLHQWVIAFTGVKEMLKKLKGRKIIFTNAPQEYAKKVLKKLGILHLFERVFSIESTKFYPKPFRRGFLHVLKSIGVDARQCCMVEDTPEILRMAKRLNMQTVLIRKKIQRPSFVDVRINSAHKLPSFL